MYTIVAETVKTYNIRLKCLDIYPYGSYVPTDLLPEYLPHLGAIILRPHGSEHFYDGLLLEKFIEQVSLPMLDTLILDSVYFCKNLLLIIILRTYF
jgi:hypothetical protein